MKPGESKFGYVGSVHHDRAKSALREYVETLVGAVLIATLIVVFVARAFTVEGPSMLPTLHSGERILVDQLSYRFREPRRGEIAVFRYPADPTQYYVKRVVGLPGDRVEIRDGQLLVNGVSVRENYIPNRYASGDFGPVAVPAEGPLAGYFVLGDHRTNSEDSRMATVGFVPRGGIMGRAVWRFWPLTELALLTAPATFGSVAASPAPALPSSPSASTETPTRAESTGPRAEAAASADRREGMR